MTRKGRREGPISNLETRLGLKGWHEARYKSQETEYLKMKLHELFDVDTHLRANDLASSQKLRSAARQLFHTCGPEVRRSKLKTLCEALTDL